MRITGGFRTVEDMVDTCERQGGMPRQILDRMNEVLKGARVKTKHLSHWKKVKGFGECARDYKFDKNKGKGGAPDMISIQKYFENTHPNAFKTGTMKFPTLPTINFGSATKEDLMPAELSKSLMSLSKELSTAIKLSA